MIGYDFINEGDILFKDREYVEAEKKYKEAESIFSEGNFLASSVMSWEKIVKCKLRTDKIEEIGDIYVQIVNRVIAAEHVLLSYSIYKWLTLAYISYLLTNTEKAKGLLNHSFFTPEQKQSLINNKFDLKNEFDGQYLLKLLREKFKQ